VNYSGSRIFKPARKNQRYRPHRIAPGYRDLLAAIDEDDFAIGPPLARTVTANDMHLVCPRTRAPNRLGAVVRILSVRCRQARLDCLRSKFAILDEGDTPVRLPNTRAQWTRSARIPRPEWPARCGIVLDERGCVFDQILFP